MKPVYQCDWCNEIGTKEKILAHEKECIYNKNLKSCLTCENCERPSINEIKCKIDIKVPEGQYFNYCKSWVDSGKEAKIIDDFTSSLFGNWFK